MATAGHGNFIPSTVSQQFSSCHCNTGRESLQAMATSGGMWHLRFCRRAIKGVPDTFLGGNNERFLGVLRAVKPPMSLSKVVTAEQKSE